MGQRLVVTVTNCGENIAKIYYHWSAYSLSALEEAKDIINALYDDECKENDIRLRLIRFCEQNGGGIKGGKDSDEWKYISQLYPNEVFKEDNISRNYGLIALSESGMENLQDWSEGDVYIEMDNDRIINYVNYSYGTIDEYNGDRSEWDEDFKELTLDDIPSITHDLTDFSMDCIDDTIFELKSLKGYVCRYGNTIYDLIA